MTSPSQHARQKEVVTIRESLTPAQAAVVAHYSGITVENITKLRADLRKDKVRLKVIKNTLATRAVEGTPLAALKDSFKGPTALVYTETDPVTLAKVLVEFAKKEEKFKIQAGVLGGKILALKEIESLAKMPGREVLLARLCGSLQAPYAGLVYTLSGVLRKFVYALDAVRRQKEEKGAN